MSAEELVINENAVVFVVGLKHREWSQLWEDSCSNRSSFADWRDCKCEWNKAM